MKDILQNFFPFLILWSGAFAASAQTTKPVAQIEMIASDSIIYSVFLDGQPKIEMVKGNQSFTPQNSGFRLIDVVLHVEPVVHLRTTLHVDSLQTTKVRIVNDHTSFTLIKEGGNTSAIDYTKPASANDSANELVVEVNIGSSMRCAPPVAPELVMSWVDQLQSRDFEREKFRFLEGIFSESCLTVQQIQVLIGTIEDESRRFSLLQLAFGNCFNQHNYDRLKNLLYLERTQLAFEQWLERARSAQAIGSGK